MTKLSKIEGIGDIYAEKLKGAGIASIENLLDVCCEKKGRKKIGAKVNVSEKLILGWVNRADLTRINGVSTQYADLLEYTGVDTVPELAQRKPENLHEKIAQVNEEKKLVRKIPALSQIQDWVAQAKKLPRIIYH
ncbi:hypothetical protein MNBD_GAMMA16-1616 [hydrothermal vent metagenome]|uniref:DUF4332 domain-containing protein n=1 Tax=hydrothermal vent metagenome TaxID=652676 RepID=A0A3B0ZSS6_9ZZZZ